MNEVRLIGNLATDPDVGSNAETAPVKFVVISNNRRRESKRKAVVPVKVFGKAKAFAAGLQKGQQVFVSGKLQTDQWEDQKSGQTQSQNHLYADWVIPMPK